MKLSTLALGGSMKVITLAVATARGVVTVTYYFVRRADMKNGDRRIETERQRERERESESESLRKQPETTTLTHFSHRCPLTEVNGTEVNGMQVNGTANGMNCNACEGSVSGLDYRCTSTSDSCRNFFLHKVCATNPATFLPCMDRLAQEMSSSYYGQTTIRTFAHSDHDVKEIYSNVDYTCKHCFTPGSGKRFRCETENCKVVLHPLCATNPTKISSFLHPEHELELKTKRHFKNCAICHRNMGSNIRVYRCKECGFYVHPACSQLPQYLLHDLHPLSHPLKLKRATCSRRCDAKCKKNCKSGRWCYECGICEVNFHIGCLQKHSLKHYMPSASEKTRVDVFIQLLTIVEKIVKIDNGVVTLVQAL